MPKVKRVFFQGSRSISDEELHAAVNIMRGLGAMGWEISLTYTGRFVKIMMSEAVAAGIMVHCCTVANVKPTKISVLPNPSPVDYKNFFQSSIKLPTGCGHSIRTLQIAWGFRFGHMFHDNDAFVFMESDSSAMAQLVPTLAFCESKNIHKKVALVGWDAEKIEALSILMSIDLRTMPWLEIFSSDHCEHLITFLTQEDEDFD